MKRPHLVRVEAPIESFATLIARARSAGLRVGWLALAEPSVPPTVAAIVDGGVSQCVVAGERWTITARTRSGLPVTQDLVRQYFLGCQLVLVSGDIELPTLQPDATGWQLVSADGRRRSFDDDQLLALFRRPPGAGRSG